MQNFDNEFRIYACVLSLLAAAVCFLKYPSAISLLGFTAIGLGGEKFQESISYAQVVVALQFSCLLTLIFRSARANGLDALIGIFRKGTTFYFVVLAALWIKILFDCMAYGIDEFRLFSLKLAIYTVFLPGAIFLMSIVATGIEATGRGLLYGLCLFSCTYLLPLAYPIYAESRVVDAAFGDIRLTTFGMDTINGGRMFFFGCVGFLLLGASLRSRNLIKIFCFMVSLAFFIFCLLNGTRQYVVAVLIAVVAVLFMLGRTREVVALSILLGVAGLGYAMRGVYAEAQVAERVTTANVQMEMAEGRGRIWREAFYVALESPLLGVGYRNFGQELSSYSEETGEITSTKDTAHGFFQDVFVEHGFVFGTLLLIGWILVIWKLARSTKMQLSLMQRFIFVLLIVFSIPETLSAAVYNSVGFHLFALGSFAIEQSAPGRLKPR
ncbi:MAG: O-antigen ligase family protein [Verrucomicrobia bacterium]|nr:O-antigen ligase family protein [Verrucomicrobiota bacterium]